MADFTQQDVAELLRSLNDIAGSIRETNELLQAHLDAHRPGAHAPTGTEEDPIHMKYVADDLVAVSGYFEGGDPRPPLPTIDGVLAHEHSFTETEPDSLCEGGCGLRYAAWTAAQ